MKPPLLSKLQQNHSLKEKNKMEGSGGAWVPGPSSFGSRIEGFQLPPAGIRSFGDAPIRASVNNPYGVNISGVTNFSGWLSRPTDLPPNASNDVNFEQRVNEAKERDKKREEQREKERELVQKTNQMHKLVRWEAKERALANESKIFIVENQELYLSVKHVYNTRKAQKRADREQALLRKQQLDALAERRRQEAVVLAEREKKAKEEKEKVFAQGFAAGEKFLDRLKDILFDGVQTEGDYMFLRGVERGKLTKEGFMLTYLKNNGWHEEYIEAFSIELKCWQKYERCENCQRMTADFKMIDSCKGCIELGMGRIEAVCMNCVRVLFPDGLRGKTLYLSCGLCAVDARGAYEYVFGGSNEAGSRGEPTFVEGERADGGKVEAQQGEPGVHKRSSPEVGGSGEDDRFAEEDDLIV